MRNIADNFKYFFSINIHSDLGLNYITTSYNDLFLISVGNEGDINMFLNNFKLALDHKIEFDQQMNIELNQLITKVNSQKYILNEELKKNTTKMDQLQQIYDQQLNDIDSNKNEIILKEYDLELKEFIKEQEIYQQNELKKINLQIDVLKEKYDLLYSQQHIEYSLDIPKQQYKFMNYQLITKEIDDIIDINTYSIEEYKQKQGIDDRNIIAKTQR